MELTLGRVPGRATENPIVLPACSRVFLASLSRACAPAPSSPRSRRLQDRLARGPSFRVPRRLHHSSLWPVLSTPAPNLASSNPAHLRHIDLSVTPRGPA